MKKRIIFLSLMYFFSLGSKSFSGKEHQQCPVQQKLKINFESSNENLSKIVKQLKGLEIMDEESFCFAQKMLKHPCFEYRNERYITYPELRADLSFECALQLLLRVNFDIEAIKNVFQDTEFTKVLRKNLKYFFEQNNGSAFVSMILSNENNLDVAKIVISHLDLSSIKTDGDDVGNLVRTVLSKDNHFALAEHCIKNIKWNEYKNFDPTCKRSHKIMRAIMVQSTSPIFSEMLFKSITWGDDFLKLSLSDMLNFLKSKNSSSITKEVLKLSNWKERIQKEKLDISVFDDSYPYFWSNLLSWNPSLELLLDGIDLNRCFVGTMFHRKYVEGLLENFKYFKNKKFAEQLLSRIQISNTEIPTIWNLCVKKLDYLKDTQFKDADTTIVVSLFLDQGGGSFKNFYEDEDFQNKYGYAPPKSHEEKILIALSMLAHSDFVYAKKMLDQLNEDPTVTSAFLKKHFNQMLEHLMFSNKDETVEYFLNKLDFDTKMNQSFNTKVGTKREEDIKLFQKSANLLLDQLICAKNGAIVKKISKLNFWRFISDLDQCKAFIKGNNLEACKLLVTKLPNKEWIQSEVTDKDTVKHIFEKILATQAKTPFHEKNSAEIYDTFAIALESPLTEDVKTIIDTIDYDGINCEKLLSEYLIEDKSSNKIETVHYLIHRLEKSEIFSKLDKTIAKNGWGELELRVLCPIVYSKNELLVHCCLSQMNCFKNIENTDSPADLVSRIQKSNTRIMGNFLMEKLMSKQLTSEDRANILERIREEDQRKKVLDHPGIDYAVRAEFKEKLIQTFGLREKDGN
ncbi:hypothetical protein P618_200313 [Holospora obtusa F1]|uniref:Uncharacterized protein n=1 Tax=Holospora obtusa F1 TaxID=1399147 RepID=W6TEX7_HOLOB|nr:hypothetical protein [Holospora obtusa]ETZ07496.1 hypothetical protein P618_200313 [Holospora obtusa F1]